MQTRERHKEYMREWRLRNPRYLEANMRWLNRNREHCREYFRKYRKTIEGKYSKYKYRAKKGSREFSLTLEEFRAFLSLPCHYCGLKASGIDRKDNKRGYIPINCLSCCWRCNRFKGTMVYNDFIQSCYQISKHLYRL